MTSPFLEAAVAIGHGLVARAELGAAGRVWRGDTVVGANPADAQVVRTVMGPDLYGGGAGIGWFLAHLAAATADPGLAEHAGATLRDAAVQAGSSPSLGPGLYTGRSGVALALREASVAISDPALAQAAAQLTDQVVREIADDGPPASHDLIDGVSGVIIALTAALDGAPGPGVETTIRALAGPLAKRAEGWRDDDPEDPPLCGLGHGASGTAWSLCEAAARLAAPEWQEGAAAALAYERRWFSADRCAWADLRGLDGPSAEPGWTCAWCHGALGIGAVRARLWELAGDPARLAEAGAALQAARSFVVEIGLAARQGHAPDVSLCHGLGGAAELSLLAYEVSGDPEHLRAARRIGGLSLEIARRAEGRWPIGVPGGEEAPGLFLGEAGIGALMLRLHDPRLIGSPALAGRRPVTS